MSIYLERCDICREYKPVMKIKEGKETLSLCLRCAYLLGRKIWLVATHAERMADGLEKIAKVIDEITGG